MVTTETPQGADSANHQLEPTSAAAALGLTTDDSSRLSDPASSPASQTTHDVSNAITIEPTSQPNWQDSLPNFEPRHRQLLRRATAGILILLAAEWIYIANLRPDPLLLQRGNAFQSQFRISVNDATWIDWMQMEGIGPAMAHRIVAERKLHGPYQSIDDLQRVPGIGPATLDRIRPWLTMGHDQSAPPSLPHQSVDAPTAFDSNGQPASSP